MTEDYQDFVGIYNDVYPDGFCDHLIKEVDYLQECGAGSNRLQREGVPRYLKEDYVIFAVGGHIRPFNGIEVHDIFFDGLQKCFEQYGDYYSTIQLVNLKASVIKLQKIGPGQGYHVWHFEQGNNNTGNRVLTYILYLNTLNEDQAGETEFLFQQRRVRPVKNSIILWPAAFTHTHRGNPVFGNKDKYIATGWFDAIS